jgi:cytoplasmic iron level regulating protein YaaA (DUF328/UPF0246 family)
MFDYFSTPRSLNFARFEQPSKSRKTQFSLHFYTNTHMNDLAQLKRANAAFSATNSRTLENWKRATREPYMAKNRFDTVTRQEWI